jgi:hypothetical protein
LLFGEVKAPIEVKAEFLRLAGEDIRFQGLVFPAFINCVIPQKTTHQWADSPALHSGEIAALSLALELRAHLVLMDEAKGRAAAAALNLKTMGLLGILLQARKRSLVPSMGALLNRLEFDAKFWISPSLKTAILRAAGE